MGFTNFTRGITSLGNVVYGNLGIGNVYIVANTKDTVSYPQVSKRYGRSSYSDGSQMFYPHTANAAGDTVTLNGLQNALNACVSGRNDYVVVMPSSADYDITAALTMTKRNVHLICPAGVGPETGSTNAARIHQNTANTEIIILSALADGCEIAGLWFKLITSQTTAFMISTPAVSTGQCLNLHHNTFNVTASGSTGGGAYGSLAGGSGNYTNIHHNRFYFSGAASVAVGVLMITTQSIFAYNDMHAINACTVTIGVECVGVGSIVKYNNFFAHRASTGISASAFGAAIVVNASSDDTCVLGNRGCVASGTLVQGGTADTTYSDNRSAVDGGVLTVDADIDA
jgi:hypothetical protein